MGLIISLIFGCGLQMDLKVKLFTGLDCGTDSYYYS